MSEEKVRFVKASNTVQYCVDSCNAFTISKVDREFIMKLRQEQKKRNISDFVSKVSLVDDSKIHTMVQEFILPICIY